MKIAFSFLFLTLCFIKTHAQSDFLTITTVSEVKEVFNFSDINNNDEFFMEPIALRKTYLQNSLGLGGDATFYSLKSSQVVVKSGIGFIGAFETRGEFRDDFDLTYSLGIFNHNFSVDELFSGNEIQMNQLGVEVKFLLGWKIARSDNFALELGPALMIAGENKIKDNRFENAIIGSITNPVSIQDFQETQAFNVNGIVGFSTGVRHFRIMAHYHYAFLDALTGTTATGTSINGNASFLTAGARFYF